MDIAESRAIYMQTDIILRLLYLFMTGSYCGADLLDPLSWKKERYPVLASDPSIEVYEPGHNSFTVDEEGNDILVYDVRKESIIEGDPLYNPNRHTMLMKIKWENGRPVFNYK